MTARAASKIDEPDAAAYEPTFIESLTPALDDLAQNRVKLIVNAGASDTKKLHEVVTSLVEEKDLNLKVAWIEGDEVMPIVRDAVRGKTSEFSNIYTDEKLAGWKFEPLYAQAYLGGMGIAAALEAGADIVICGRVSDASPVIGAAVWWHKWQRNQLDRLANALIAGHLIECSSYVTGGNFTGSKRLQASGWDTIGYPIAEIDFNGQVIITKNQGSGGEVSIDTCTSQLLYKIQGPWYFNSDVTAILDAISFEHLSANRIALHGIKGDLPPPTTKIGITTKGGFQAECHWSITGLDIAGKAAMLECQIRRLMRPHSARFSVLECTLNGSCPDDPKDQNSATVDFRVLAQAPVADDLAPSRFARPCLDGIMCTYPGATPHLDLRTAVPSPIYEYYVTLLPQASLNHIAHTPWPGAVTQSIPIAAPSNTKIYPSRQPSNPGPSTASGSHRSTPRTRGGATDAAGGWAELPAQLGRSVLREVFGPWGRTVRGPLGWIVHARSGAQGCDCNVGFWVRRQSEYEWLRRTLSIERVKHLLGAEYKYEYEYDSDAVAGGTGVGKGNRKGKEIERQEFEGIRAVHFLLRGHLDRGVSCSRSYDALGKNTAEFLRARHVDLPVRFLDRGRI